MLSTVEITSADGTRTEMLFATSCCCVTGGKPVNLQRYHVTLSSKCLNVAIGIGSETAGTCTRIHEVHLNYYALMLHTLLAAWLRACVVCVHSYRARQPGMMERLIGGGGSRSALEQQQYEDPSISGGLRSPDSKLGREKRTCAVM